MRLFLAAELPDEVRRRLAEAQEALKPARLPVKWTRPEAIHLTFRFLGETPEAHVPAIGEAVSRNLEEDTARFRLEARGVGVFPDHGRPRVIWAGIEGDLAAAGRLKEALDKALRPLGFAEEERPFRPHLTLGRLVDGRLAPDWRARVGDLAGERFGAIEVGACVLFRSHLLPEGARYDALRRFPLEAARPEPA